MMYMMYMAVRVHDEHGRLYTILKTSVPMWVQNISATCLIEIMCLLAHLELTLLIQISTYTYLDE